MPEAARVGDAIGHSLAMEGLLVGLLIGASIGLAAVAIVGTGGLAAAAIVGGLAATGGGIMEVISTMSFVPKKPSGAIRTGSGDVFINGKKAARAHVDIADCDKHSGSHVLATGSGNVYINGLPAVRVGDKSDCSATVIEGSRNVFIGGGTQQTDAMNPENLVPGWIHAALLLVGMGSAVTLAWPFFAVGGLIGGTLFGMGGEWLGGEVFGKDSDGQKWSMLAGSLLGGYVGAKGGMASERAWTEWSASRAIGNARSVVASGSESETAGMGWWGTGGSGPAHGTIGVTDSTSVGALRNYYPKDGGVEFIYDPTTKTFVAGRAPTRLFDGSPHERLAQSIGAQDSPSLVGGTLKRGPNGEFLTNENSGHYGLRWTDPVRAQFGEWLSQRLELPVDHQWGAF